MSPLYHLALASALLLGCGGKIDLSSGAASSSSGSGSSSSSSSSSSSGSATGEKCRAGGIISFRSDFEDGVIGEEFKVNSPSAFSVDFDDVIAGSASLRVKPNKASYISRELPGVCAVRLAFKARLSPEFLAKDGNLARINAVSYRFTVFVEGGALRLRSAYADRSDGTVATTILGIVTADDTLSIVLDVDLTALKTTFTLSSTHGSPIGEVGDIPAPAFGSSPPAIRAVELGSVPGYPTDPAGTYVLDDIQMD